MLALLFSFLLILILLGVPVILALGTIAFSGIVLVPDLVPAMFPQKAYTMLDSFSLLAMPYFILAGELMTRGGLSKRLVEFAETIVGHLRGGLGHAAVVASMVHVFDVTQNSRRVHRHGEPCFFCPPRNFT